jgi:hypothetical protein
MDTAVDVPDHAGHLDDAAHEHHHNDGADHHDHRADDHYSADHHDRAHDDGDHCSVDHCSVDLDADGTIHTDSHDRDTHGDVVRGTRDPERRADLHRAVHAGLHASGRGAACLHASGRAADT